jgi:hypothetical protein
VRVNVGGDPDRDDFGLPPVDIQIPDDARDLDRDVQAYQRELRALRRRRRASRLSGPLTRDQMVMPLLAGCLILALLTSTLLIMFAAGQTGMPHAPASHAAAQPAPAGSRPKAGQIGGPLPSAAVVIGGKSVPLSKIVASGPSVLALVPNDCRCASALRQLGAQAAQAHVAVYLVGTGGGMPQMALLATRAGQSPSRVADDTANVLGTTYRQSGLTAVLVRRGGSVTSVARRLAPGLQLEAGLRQLNRAEA